METRRWTLSGPTDLISRTGRVHRVGTKDFGLLMITAVEEWYCLRSGRPRLFISGIVTARVPEGGAQHNWFRASPRE